MSEISFAMMRPTLYVCLIAFVTCHRGLGSEQINPEYNFEYDDRIGYMILRVPSSCYLWKLDDVDVANMENPAAVIPVEINMLDMLAGGSATELTVDSIPQEIRVRCKGRRVYELIASPTSTIFTPTGMVPGTDTTIATDTGMVTATDTTVGTDTGMVTATDTTIETDTGMVTTTDTTIGTDTGIVVDN